MTTDRRTYPGLDSLRGFAALGVVGTHVSFFAGYYGHGLFGAATARLDIGVAIFFVLSGFLLGRPYVEAALQRTPIDSTSRYLWKRALRIMPVYWVTVLATALLIGENRELPLHRWIANTFLVDLYVSDKLPAGLTQMWSLAIEVAFYVTLPLMFWLATRVVRGRWNFRRLYGFAIVLGVVNIAWVALSGSLLAPLFDLTGWWLPSYLLWFGIGVLIAVAASELPGSRGRLGLSLRAMAASPGTCWSAAVSLYLIACTPVAGPVQLALLTRQQSAFKIALYAAIAMLIVLPSALGREDSAYARVMAHPFPRHLGHVSYCLFCCHQLMLRLVADRFDFRLFGGRGWELFLLTAAASLLVAEALHWLVERPVQRWRNVGRDKSRAIITPNDIATRI